MTVFAEVHGDTLIRFPFTAASLREENPYTIYNTEPDLFTIFPQTDVAKKNGYSLVPVNYLPQPTYNPDTQICSQDAQPKFVNNEWVIDWAVTNMTPEQQQQVVNQKLAAVKTKATGFLQATDWVEIPSVKDTTVTPHLVNQADFITYRLALRAIAVNPTVLPNWPTIPTEQWA